MKVLFKEPGKQPIEKEIGEGLAGMQEAVGGHIETFSLRYKNLVVVLDEDGRSKGKKFNTFVPYMTMRGAVPVDIIGNLFICVARGEHLTGLNTEEMRAAKELLAQRWL